MTHQPGAHWGEAPCASNYNLALYWVKPINTFIFTVISFFNAGENGYATFVKKSQRSIQRER